MSEKPGGGRSAGYRVRIVYSEPRVGSISCAPGSGKVCSVNLGGERCLERAGRGPGRRAS